MVDKSDVVTTPTVLVLGAGASAPYGFPSAEELKNQICREFSSEDHPGYKYFDRHSKYNGKEFFRFRQALIRSGRTSVDAFLERRPEFIPVGKLAIAYCLMPYEHEDKLFEARPTSGGGDWYQHLFGSLDAPFEQFDQNRLSVITFNYDRSLERYLLTVLQNAYGRPESECVDILARIQIEHVYGQLSVIPYPQKGSNSYLPDRDPFTAVEGAAEGIKILHEEANSGFDNAHRLLSNAERVYFLGFGYHALNVSRLTITPTRSKTIFGTAQNLVGDELRTAQTRVYQALGVSSDIRFRPHITLVPDADNLSLLRQHSILG